MAKIKVSVIVPVYNTCAFLPACVESILGQTYTDWELLLVDDGSTDGSLQIARQYAQADPRIRVLHQENCGVSAARNQGIRAAGGSYICFVDSDDTIETSLLSDMAAVLQRTQADCVASGLTYEFEENGTTRAYTVQEGLISLPTDLNQRFQDLADARMLNSHCGKLFKKAILDACSIRMVEGISTLEDGIFLLDYLAHCSSIYCLSSAAYHYRQIPGSLQKRYSPNALQAWLLYAQKYRDLTTYLDVSFTVCSGIAIDPSCPTYIPTPVNRSNPGVPCLPALWKRFIGWISSKNCHNVPNEVSRGGFAFFWCDTNSQARFTCF